MIKVRLYSRHFGVHTFIKETKIKGLSYNKIVEKKKCPIRGYEYFIDDKVLAEKVKEVFNIIPKKCLLTVSEDDSGSTGVSECNHFMPWAKYFDSYIIEICKK